jgi:AraC-like DNA-binding protein
MALVLRSLAVAYGDGHVIDLHAHGWGQVVYAAGGAISVATARAAWLVPPARAVWLPPGEEHRLRMRGATQLRTVYVAPRKADVLPAACCGLDVSPLLRELILHITRLPPLDDAVPAHGTLANLLVDLLEQARALPFLLREPSDPRAARVCALIRADPAAGLSVSMLASHAGAAPRTLQRLFVAETGLRLAEWRQAARLMNAAMLLLEGASVTRAGLASGYASTSAFVSAFRRRTGMTPLAYRALGTQGL